MSEIAESARGTLIAADYASVDAVGKINMIGGAVTITGVLPSTGLTAPLTLIATVGVDPRFLGQEYTLEVALYDLGGNLVSSTSGPLEPQPVRVAQLVRAEPVAFPQGTWLPGDAVWPTSQMILNFQNGLPLTAGTGYEWRLTIDGEVITRLSLGVSGTRPTTIG